MLQRSHSCAAFSSQRATLLAAPPSTKQERVPMTEDLENVVLRLKQARLSDVQSVPLSHALALRLRVCRERGLIPPSCSRMRSPEDYVEDDGRRAKLGRINHQTSPMRCPKRFAAQLPIPVMRQRIVGCYVLEEVRSRGSGITSLPGSCRTRSH